ncbi:uncharacterized protein LOC116921762 [Daphnia magna]|uniref:uncharacterized protein LOC116921762 n=1 Tax=Daphnia magna TaxID=35525 RepID=UPI001E1BC19C|nr:uncharacterized protein LOC116921762 [Daphnia magna]
MYGPTQEMLPFIPIPSSLVGNATSFPVSGGQVSIPPQNHMDLPYRELAPNEQHPFFIATGGQENLDKSYASTPALRTFHTNAPMLQQEALVNRNSRQSTGLHLAGPPSQQASNSMPSQAPTPAQQGNWNALYAGTSSAGHQPIQDQPATAQQTNFYGQYFGSPPAVHNNFQTPPTQQNLKEVQRSIKRFSPMTTPRTEEAANSIENVKIMDCLAKMVREFAKHQETQNVLVSKLNAIEVKLDNVQQLGGASNYQEDDESDHLLLPLGDIGAMKPFEESLKDKDKYYKLVSLIRGIGGSSLSDAMKRAWTKVLSLKVRAGCNWEGKLRNGTRKHGLEKSAITRAIFEGVKGVPQFRNARQSELEWETKNFMKRAPEQVRSEEAVAAGNPVVEPPAEEDPVQVEQPN